MDPFEEFQMRPLTKGLGFHNKQTSIKEVVKKASLSTTQLPKSIPAPPPPEMLDNKRFNHGGSTYEDLLKSLSNPSPETLTRPVDEPKAKEIRVANQRLEERIKSVTISSAISKASQASEAFFQPAFEPEVNIPMDKIRTPFDITDETVKESDIFPLSKKISRTTNNGEGIGVRRGGHDSPFIKLKAASFSVPSAFLDLVVVTAFSMVFLVSLLMITKVSLSTVFANSTTDRMTQFSLGLIFVAVFQMYSIISRTFFGRTLGEWTFEFQLGRDEEQKKWNYPLKVVWRSILITLTGVIIFPIMSLAAGADLVAPLTGLRLFKKSY